MKIEKSMARRTPRKQGLFTKILARIGISLLLLIPTYIAIFSYVWVKSKPEVVVETYYTSFELKGPNGSAFTTEPNTDLFNAFKEMLTDAVYTTSIPDTHLSGRYTVTLQTNTGSEHYTFYFSTADDAAYYVNESGTIYRTVAGAATTFLNSTYAYELYPHSVPPVLTTAVTDKIIPSSLGWYYQTQNGTFASLSHITTTEEILTYPIANDVSFTFSLPPTSCSLVIRYGDTEQTYNSVNNISLPTLTQGTVLDIRIEASFAEDSRSNYYGLAVYTFRMVVVEAASFSLDAVTKYLGDYFMLTCHNVKNETELVISATPALQNPPLIFRRGDTVYAAIPADTVCNDPSAPARLTVVYGSVSDTFELTILPPRSTDDLTFEATALRGSWEEAVGALLVSKMKENGAKAESDAAQSFLPTANFILPIANGEKAISFGDALTVEGTTVNQSTSLLEYYKATGFVVAMGGGYVVQTGFDSLLGNYVILDHGGGIYTWYCGLGSIAAELQGATSQYVHYVAAGDVIGTAGQTGLGFADTDGVMILATCGQTAISPQYLREQDASFATIE